MLRSQKHIFECRINFFKNYTCKFCSFISSNRKNVELHLKNFKHVEKKSKQKLMKTSVTIKEDMQINKNVPAHSNIFGVQKNIKIEDEKSEQVKHLKIPNTIKKLRNVIDIDGLKSDGFQQDIVFMDSRSQQKNKNAKDSSVKFNNNVIAQGTTFRKNRKIKIIKRNTLGAPRKNFFHNIDKLTNGMEINKLKSDGNQQDIVNMANCSQQENKSAINSGMKFNNNILVQGTTFGENRNMKIINRGNLDAPRKLMFYNTDGLTNGMEINKLKYDGNQQNIVNMASCSQQENKSAINSGMKFNNNILVQGTTFGKIRKIKIIKRNTLGAPRKNFFHNIDKLTNGMEINKLKYDGNQQNIVNMASCSQQENKSAINSGMKFNNNILVQGTTFGKNRKIKIIKRNTLGAPRKNFFHNIDKLTNGMEINKLKSDGNQQDILNMASCSQQENKSAINSGMKFNNNILVQGTTFGENRNMKIINRGNLDAPRKLMFYNTDGLTNGMEINKLKYDGNQQNIVNMASCSQQENKSAINSGMKFNNNILVQGTTFGKNRKIKIIKRNTLGAPRKNFFHNIDKLTNGMEINKLKSDGNQQDIVNMASCSQQENKSAINSGMKFNNNILVQGTTFGKNRKIKIVKRNTLGAPRKNFFHYIDKLTNGMEINKLKSDGNQQDILNMASCGQQEKKSAINSGMKFNNNILVQGTTFEKNRKIKIIKRNTLGAPRKNFFHNIDKLTYVMEINKLKSDGNQQDIVNMASCSQQENKSAINSGMKFNNNILVQGTTFGKNRKIKIIKRNTLGAPRKNFFHNIDKLTNGMEINKLKSDCNQQDILNMASCSQQENKSAINSGMKFNNNILIQGTTFAKNRKIKIIKRNTLGAPRKKFFHTIDKLTNGMEMNKLKSDGNQQDIVNMASCSQQENKSAINSGMKFNNNILVQGTTFGENRNMKIINRGNLDAPRKLIFYNTDGLTNGMEINKLKSDGNQQDIVNMASCSQQENKSAINSGMKFNNNILVQGTTFGENRNMKIINRGNLDAPRKLMFYNTDGLTNGMEINKLKSDGNQQYIVNMANCSQQENKSAINSGMKFNNNILVQGTTFGENRNMKIINRGNLDAPRKLMFYNTDGLTNGMEINKLKYDGNQQNIVNMASCSQQENKSAINSGMKFNNNILVQGTTFGENRNMKIINGGNLDAPRKLMFYNTDGLTNGMEINKLKSDGNQQDIVNMASCSQHENKSAINSGLKFNNNILVQGTTFGKNRKIKIIKRNTLGAPRKKFFHNKDKLTNGMEINKLKYDGNQQNIVNMASCSQQEYKSAINSGMKFNNNILVQGTTFEKNRNMKIINRGNLDAPRKLMFYNTDGLTNGMEINKLKSDGNQQDIVNMASCSQQENKSAINSGMKFNNNILVQGTTFEENRNMKIINRGNLDAPRKLIFYNTDGLTNGMEINKLKSDGNQQDIVNMASCSQQENKSVMDTGEQLKTNVLVQGTSSEEQMKIQDTDSVTGELCGIVPISNCMMGIDPNMGIGGETDDLDLETMTSQMFDEAALSISWLNDLLC